MKRERLSGLGGTKEEGICICFRKDNDRRKYSLSGKSTAMKDLSKIPNAPQKMGAWEDGRRPQGAYALANIFE